MSNKEAIKSAIKRSLEYTTDDERRNSIISDLHKIGHMNMLLIELLKSVSGAELEKFIKDFDA